MYNLKKFLACYNSGMDNGQLDISTIIIAVVSAVIGAILFSVGNRKNKRMLRVRFGGPFYSGC